MDDLTEVNLALLIMAFVKMYLIYQWITSVQYPYPPTRVNFRYEIILKVLKINLCGNMKFERRCGKPS
jgi:hypothetical protein